LNGMFVLPSRADIVRPTRHVRFVPKADITAGGPHDGPAKEGGVD
jgi:hypothetical protein